MQVKIAVIACAAALMPALSVDVCAQTTADFFDGTVLQELRLDINPTDCKTLRVNYLDNTYYPCNFRWKFQSRYIEVGSISFSQLGQSLGLALWSYQ